MVLHRSPRQLIRVWPLVLTLMIAGAGGMPAQTSSPPHKSPRVLPPEFDADVIEEIFFQDAFAEGLQGSRPTLWNLGPPGGPEIPQSAAAPPRVPGEGAQFRWSTLISREVLEDEVKLSAQRLGQLITVPTRFAGGDYRGARHEFSWLAVLFAVIATDDQQVRWQSDALAAHERFAGAAAGMRRGDATTFRTAQSALSDLQDLIRGNPLAAREDARLGKWGDFADRSLLMQRLERTFADDISPALAQQRTARAQTSEIVHASQIIALISRLLTQPARDDAEDEQYAEYCRQMLEAAAALEEAVQAGRFEATREAAGEIHKACTNCHGTFRD